MPPRHGKSLLSSILFPAWMLGNDPDHRIIATSYSADLSHTFSRQTRNLVASPEYREVFPDVELAPDARAVGQWELADPNRGGYVSAGVGGSITGKGAGTLIIDDPVKDAEEAKSETMLEKIWEWYGTTAYTRLQKGGAVLIIMTRWAELDLTGRVLEAMSSDPAADQWEVVHLPAYAEEGDQLGREIGEPLWPEMYPREELESRRVTLGSRGFAALYQQRPAPAEGAIFKREWWQRFDLERFDRTSARTIIQVWDTAFEAKTTNDYSVCATWALVGKDAYLLDIARARLEFPELKKRAKDLAAKWRPSVICIEKKSSGHSLAQELDREKDLNIVRLEVDRDKVARANAVTPYIEAGRVYLPDSAPWVEDFIEEHAAFDAGAHDDQVDTTSMALERLLGRFKPLAGPTGMTRRSTWRSAR